MNLPNAPLFYHWFSSFYPTLDTPRKVVHLLVAFADKVVCSRVASVSTSAVEVDGSVAIGLKLTEAGLKLLKGDENCPFDMPCIVLIFCANIENNTGIFTAELIKLKGVKILY